jgi:hypothetical protein
MNNGITGYNAGRTNPYRQVEKRPAATAAVDGQDASRRAEQTSDRIRLGSDLSEAEAGMIDNKFPESERMRLRLYGPGSQASSVDPGGRGGRLDLKG